MYRSMRACIDTWDSVCPNWRVMYRYKHHMYRYISVNFENLKNNQHVSMQCLFVSIQNALFSIFLKTHELISLKNNFYDFQITCMYETHITNKVHFYVCEQNKVPKHIITWEHMSNHICMIRHSHKSIKVPKSIIWEMYLWMYAKSHLGIKQTYTTKYELNKIVVVIFVKSPFKTYESQKLINIFERKFLEIED